MPKSKRRGGSTSSNGSENRRPGRNSGHHNHKVRAGAGERADAANPIPGFPWGTGGLSDPGAANGSGWDRDALPLTSRH